MASYYAVFMSPSSEYQCLIYLKRKFDIENAGSFGRSRRKFDSLTMDPMDSKTHDEPVIEV